jgi:uncharacterized protein YuzE
MDERKKDLKVKYDAVSDIAYFSLGSPRKAISEEAGNGLVIRRDSETDEVVGITIIDFAKRTENNREFSIPLPLLGKHRELAEA